MEASSKRTRVGRYTRAAGPAKTLTPLALDLLEFVGEFEILSVPLLARVSDLSQKAVRRLMRVCFDHGLVSIVAVPRALLADPSGSNSAALAFGSAPNIFVLTAAGQKLLHDLGRLERTRPVKRYGPQNGAFLGHELLIKSVRCFLMLASKRSEQESLQQWREDADAAISLDNPGAPKQVRPDAWFTYALGNATLVAFLEADKGTERGSAGRWRDKLTQYEALFTSGRLKVVTGFNNARILVIAPGAERRDRLSAFIKAQASAFLADRFWLAEQTVLGEPSLYHPLWRRPGRNEMFPLIMPPHVGDNEAST